MCCRKRLAKVTIRPSFAGGARERRPDRDESVPPGVPRPTIARGVGAGGEVGPETVPQAWLRVSAAMRDHPELRAHPSLGRDTRS